MGSTMKSKNHNAVDEAASFHVQVCSGDGRLLSEYQLTRTDNSIATLEAAEDHIHKDFSDYKGEPLIVFVSQETLTKFRQLQMKVVAAESDAA